VKDQIILIQLQTRVQMSNWPDNQGGLQNRNGILPSENAIYAFALLNPIRIRYII
jgi:hypothetical protein